VALRYKQWSKRVGSPLTIPRPHISLKILVFNLLDSTWCGRRGCRSSCRRRSCRSCIRRRTGPTTAEPRPRTSPGPHRRALSRQSHLKTFFLNGESFLFNVRPNSHETFLHTILRKKDIAIKRHFSTNIFFHCVNWKYLFLFIWLDFWM